MKKMNAFFTIGTIGIIVTAIFHILTTIFIPGPALEFAFFIIYPVFIIFLAIGFWKIIKEQKTA